LQYSGGLPDGPTRASEVAIVGAGVTGLSIAWNLLQRGVERVVVLEQSGIGAGASGVQPGGVRQQWATRINCELAAASVAFYRDVAERLDARARPVLERGGYLFTADTEQVLDGLRANVAVQNACGIPSRIVDAAEAEELVPGLDGAAVVGASYCGEDGYFDKPQAVVEAFGEAAVRSGADLRIASVETVERDGDGWSVRLAGGERLAADNVVVAAGYDSASIVAPLGLELPIEKQARYLFYSDPIEDRLLEPLVVSSERRLAAKQLANGRVLASDLGADGDPESGRDHWRRNVGSGIRSLLPVLEYVSFPLLVEGFYDVTPDHQPVLGPVESFDGLWMAAGFSGHGFMLAPAVGDLLAAAIVDGAIPPSLDALSLNRFGGSELTPEYQIV
jgi:sarcosine oxidase subunit beta